LNHDKFNKIINKNYLHTSEWGGSNIPVSASLSPVQKTLKVKSWLCVHCSTFVQIVYQLLLFLARKLRNKWSDFINKLTVGKKFVSDKV